ncbi:hypothetical protein [Bdellovibrio sp.]|uniref:hypothetical protein n=1 Tax=Bdellovibrio TaxID=958 RepID=UPI00322160ED
MKLFQTVFEKMPVIYLYSCQEEGYGGSSLDRAPFDDLPEICKKMLGPLFEGFSLILWDRIGNTDSERKTAVYDVADDILDGVQDQRIALVDLVVTKDLVSSDDLIFEVATLEGEDLVEIVADTLRMTLSLKIRAENGSAGDRFFSQFECDRFVPFRLKVNERVFSYGPVVGVPEEHLSLQVFRMLTPMLSGILKSNNVE